MNHKVQGDLLIQQIAVHYFSIARCRTERTNERNTHLSGQLLRAKLERGYHLCPTLFGLGKAIGEEHDFTDQRIVRNHHGNGPEERLERIRQI